MRTLLLAVILHLVAVGSLLSEEKTVSTYQGKSVEFWAKRLEHDDSKERELAMEAIEVFGKNATPAVPVLIRWLDDGCERYRTFAC